MTDGHDSIEVRIRRYVENNLGAGVIEILGALALSPEYRDLVEATLRIEDATPEEGESATTLCYWTSAGATSSQHAAKMGEISHERHTGTITRTPRSGTPSFLQTSDRRLISKPTANWPHSPSRTSNNAGSAS